MKRILVITIFSSIFIGATNKDSDSLFDAAIRKAKQAYHIKSFRRGLEACKNCIDKQVFKGAQKLKQPELGLLQELASNKEVLDFINRPAEQVTFNDFHEPVIASKKEQALYNILDADASYRGSIKNGSFFRLDMGKGLQEYTTMILEQTLRRGLPTANNEVHINAHGTEVQALRQHVEATAPQVTSDYYKVNKQYENGHAFVTVVKYSTAHEPITFLINSWSAEGYFNSLERRFNENYATPRLFIQASFDLQKISDGIVVDYNCHLYALEFAKAAIQYLQNTDTTELHAACVSGEYVHAASLLHEGMKPYLPYYECVNGGCTEVSRDTIRKHHRSLRWHISGRVVHDFLQNVVAQQIVV